MMKKLKTITGLTLALLVGIFMSCKKDAAPVEQKPTTDIVYSDWVAAKNFRDTTIDNSNLKVADLDAPEISAEVLKKCAIQVYFDYGGGAFPLPYTSLAGGKENTVSFLPKLKRLIITRFTTDNSRGVAISSFLRYRYVILYKNDQVMAAQASVNMRDYNAVKSYFNITD